MPGRLMARAIKSIMVPGFTLEFHERVAALVEMVGGLVEASKVAGVDRDTVNNWRKAGARVPILGLLPLAVRAGVTLDWVATGNQQRPDIEALGWRQVGAEEQSSAPPASGLVQIAPMKGELHEQDGQLVRRLEPSVFAVSELWLKERHGLAVEDLRYALAGDDGMASIIPKGSMIIVQAEPAKALTPGLYVVEIRGVLLARRLNVTLEGEYELAADDNPTWRYPLPSKRPMLFRVLWSIRQFDDH